MFLPFMLLSLVACSVSASQGAKIAALGTAAVVSDMVTLHAAQSLLSDNHQYNRVDKELFTKRARSKIEKCHNGISPHYRNLALTAGLGASFSARVGLALQCKKGSLTCFIGSVLFGLPMSHVIKSGLTVEGMRYGMWREYTKREDFEEAQRKNDND